MEIPPEGRLESPANLPELHVMKDNGAQSAEEGGLPLLTGIRD